MPNLGTLKNGILCELTIKSAAMKMNIRSFCCDMKD